MKWTRITFKVNHQPLRLRTSIRSCWSKTAGLSLISWIKRTLLEITTVPLCLKILRRFTRCYLTKLNIQCKSWTLWELKRNSLHRHEESFKEFQVTSSQSLDSLKSKPGLPSRFKAPLCSKLKIKILWHNSSKVWVKLRNKICNILVWFRLEI